MKIINWLRRAAALLAAAGLWQSPAGAVEIPLADPSFESVVIPTNVAAASQYAYARDVRAGRFSYRPASGTASAWISRPDDNIGGQNFQDGGPDASNWIYTSAYAELSVANPGGGAVGKRPAPRTGNQAMHGRGLFNGQEVPATTAVFEAGKTYTFALYAQGDSNAYLSPEGWLSRVYLFLYDGDVPLRTPTVSANELLTNPEVFTALTYDASLHDATSVNFQNFPPDRFAPDEPIPPELTEVHPGAFVNRGANATAADSRAAWQKISVSWHVLPGAAEVGHPIGVAFWLFDDGAVDDASLTASGGLGDFNGDALINAQDWAILRSNQFVDLSALSESAAYLAGDITGDRFNDHADFIAFKNAYDDAHGAGSFQALLASVPEPSSSLALGAGGAAAMLRRRRVASAAARRD